MNEDKNAVPSYDKMMKPVLQALQEAGGAAENDRIDEMAIKIMGLSPETASVPHGNGKRSEVSYRIAWAKTYLKKYGLICNPTRGVWKLTEQFDGNIESVNVKQIVSYMARQSLQNFQNSDMTNLESHEAFERFALAGLEKYANLLDKTFIIGENAAPCDALIPQGLNGDGIPTYVEIRYVTKMRAGKEYLLKVVEQAFERLLKVKEALELLIILGANISEDLKSELCRASQSADSSRTIKLTLWDYSDFTEKMRDTELGAEYLINPKRMLIEDKILSPPTSAKQRQDRDALIKELKEAYDRQDITLFLGAGVSMDAGIPLWGELIHKLLFHMINERLGNTDLDKKELEAISRLAYQNREDSPLTQMRYIRTAFEKDEYYNLVREVLYENDPSCDTALIDSIVNISTPRRKHIGVKSIVTYNFDNLVERNLDGNKVAYKIIYREDDIPDVDRLSIHHVHGFLPADSDIEDIEDYDLVFSEEDYHKVYRDAYCWSNIVQLNAFRESTCLFIGCSLTDPNMRRLLDVAARSEETPRHFAVMKKKRAAAGADSDIKLLEQYYEIDQNIRVGYYQSLGINIIWVDDYSEIPEIINSLKR